MSQSSRDFECDSLSKVWSPKIVYNAIGWIILTYFRVVSKGMRPQKQIRKMNPMIDSFASQRLFWEDLPFKLMILFSKGQS